MTDTREAIRREAVAQEQAGHLAEALQLWRLLGRAGGKDVVATVAASRVKKLTRRLENRERANAIVAAGEDAVRRALDDAAEGRHLELVAEIRRVQAAQQRDVRTLTALGSALRRAGEVDEAMRVLDEAICLDASKSTNRAAYVARGALLRELGRRAEARSLLEELHRLAPRDPYTAVALAAVYLDYVQNQGHADLLIAAEKLARVAYAQRRDDAETRHLYHRIDALKNKPPFA